MYCYHISSSFSFLFFSFFFFFFWVMHGAGHLESVRLNLQQCFWWHRAAVQKNLELALEFEHNMVTNWPYFIFPSKMSISSWILWTSKWLEPPSTQVLKLETQETLGIFPCPPPPTSHQWTLFILPPPSLSCVSSQLQPHCHGLGLPKWPTWASLIFPSYSL